MLLTDNAREYTSQELAKFLDFYNTKKVEIVNYHPSSQGFCERLNREINKILRIFVDAIFFQISRELNFAVSRIKFRKFCHIFESTCITRLEDNQFYFRSCNFLDFVV